MSNTTTIEPKTEIPHELHEPLQVLKQYGVPAAIGVGLALAIILGVVYYRNRGESTRRDAQMLLASARSFDDLERVVNDYATTPSAPLALLKLAHGYYAAGNASLAAEKYKAFTASFGTHELAPVAELGVLHCTEAQGQYEAAATGFEQFATKHPAHFLAPQATLGQARCLESLGRLTQARVVYEQFVAAHPDSAWSGRAEEMLRLVNRQIAAGRDGIPRHVVSPSPAAPAAPPATASELFAPMTAVPSRPEAETIPAATPPAAVVPPLAPAPAESTAPAPKAE